LSTTTNLHREFRINRRGISNVIVMVLSLVILVIIVSNIIFWSYEMNQVDWERMQEDLSIVSANTIHHSSWFTATQEYIVDIGGHESGTYKDTHSINDTFETFTEELTDEFTLEIRGFFAIDTSIYPLDQIQTMEMQLRLRSTDSDERWYLRAYNWSSSAFGDNGFNVTEGYTSTANWSCYTVNLTQEWQHYVHVNGSMAVKIVDEVGDLNQTSVDIDFLGIRAVIDGADFIFRNNGPTTMHLLSLWVNNQTHHQRYDIDAFLNSAETSSYISCSVLLPSKPYTVKVVTKRGNMAVYAKS
jgi:hypothetical protein